MLRTQHRFGVELGGVSPLTVPVLCHAHPVLLHPSQMRGHMADSLFKKTLLIVHQTFQRIPKQQTGSGPAP
jgi:hypothetical protein